MTLLKNNRFKVLAAVLGACLAASLILALVGVNPAQADTEKPKADSAKAKGQIQLTSTVLEKFKFVAKNVDTDSANDDAKGKVSREFQFKTSKGTIKNKLTAQVECLRVEGNRAVLVSKVTKSTTGDIEFFLVSVTDGGPNGEGDRFLTAEVSEAEAETCPAPTGGTNALASGDIVVNDEEVTVS